MNRAILLGHLGGKPELRRTNGGKAVANFSLAINDGKDKPPTWLRVTCWDKLAETVTAHLDKGRQVLVEGRIQVSQYEKDGEKRTSTEIVAHSVQFLGGGKGDRSESRPSAPPPSGPPDDDLGDIPF